MISLITHYCRHSFFECFSKNKKQYFNNTIPIVLQKELPILYLYNFCFFRYYLKVLMNYEWCKFSTIQKQRWTTRNHYSISAVCRPLSYHNTKISTVCCLALNSDKPKHCLYMAFTNHSDTDFYLPAWSLSNTYIRILGMYTCLSYVVQLSCRTNFFVDVVTKIYLRTPFPNT